jgi:RNA polymerase sigma-70 factor (ECF subfamily)
VGRKDIAEDVVQEAFIQCHREIKRLRSPETFETWFYRILVRLSWRIASKEKGWLSLEPLDNAKGMSTSNADVTDTVETIEMQRAVQQAVRRLSTPLKTTIVLRYFNGLSVKEIAQVLNCRVGTVESRLHNAARQLAVELKQNGWEPSLGGKSNPSINKTSSEKERSVKQVRKQAQFEEWLQASLACKAEEIEPAADMWERINAKISVMKKERGILLSGKRLAEYLFLGQLVSRIMNKEETVMFRTKRLVSAGVALAAALILLIGFTVTQPKLQIATAMEIAKNDPQIQKLIEDYGVEIKQVKLQDGKAYVLLALPEEKVPGLLKTLSGGEKTGVGMMRGPGQFYIVYKDPKTGEVIESSGSVAEIDLKGKRVEKLELLDKTKLPITLNSRRRSQSN